jgi:hypothetical protein
MAGLQRVMEQSADWLFEHQDPETGGWADQLGRPASVLNTAEAMIALLDAKAAPPGDTRIQRGVQYLVGHRATGGRERGAWVRDVPGAGGGTARIPDLVRTSFAVEALLKAGVAVSESEVREAADWLMSVRNADNGWGYSRGSPSGIMPTAFAVTALLEAHKAGMQLEQGITPSLKFLIGHRNIDGSFGDATPLQAVHTIEVVLVLQSARVARLSVYSREERTAIEWLLEHPDEARKLIEEDVTIDPVHKRGNYGFLFVTDSLLIRVLSNSDQREHRDSQLARDAMLGIRDRLDRSGGSFGYRVFSWSTAKVLSGLNAMSAHVDEFPKRQPEYAGLKVGNLVLAFAVLLSGFAAYLAAKAKFDLTLAVLFIFLMLAALLAYGRIGEKTFKELVKVNLGLLGKKGGK